MKAKKLLSLILSAALLSAAACASADNAPSEWAKADIGEAETLGIVPDDFTADWMSPIKRAEFCTLAYNSLQQLLGGLPELPIVSPFKDTDSREVAYLNALGVINGKSKTEFAPNDLLTREEAAAILDRAAKLAGIDTDGTIRNDIAYADDAQISDWARTGVYNMYAVGIMKGTDKGFEPKSSYTVEQSIVTLMRTVRLFPSAAAPAPAPVQKPETFADKMTALMPSDRNYMFSPFSVQTALALAANGADGETKSEILSAAGISDLDAFNKASKERMKKYSETDAIKVNIANSIWLNKSRADYTFSDAYNSALSEYYSAESGTVTDSDAVETINKWVSDKTNAKIPTIINNSDFRAMLVNAVYFKGAWQNEFTEGATAPDTFTNADGTAAQTDFMNDTGWYSYAEANGARILELPYRNFSVKSGENGEYLGTERYDLDISMYILLSDGAVNPDAAVKSARAAGLFNNTYVRLSMPKFKFDYETSLNDMLKQLGIKKAFGESADFSKMFKSGNMQLTDTVHKTYIDVNEKGTEAAAVTGIAMAGSALPPEPIEFKANKPFYFMICDNSDGTVLFAGRYASAK